MVVVWIMMFQRGGGGGLTEGTNQHEKKKDNDRGVDTSVSWKTIRKSCATDYVHPNQFYLVGIQEDDTPRGYFLCNASFH